MQFSCSTGCFADEQLYRVNVPKLQSVGTIQLNVFSIVGCPLHVPNVWFSIMKFLYVDFYRYFLFESPSLVYHQTAHGKRVNLVQVQVDRGLSVFV